MAEKQNMHETYLKQSNVYSAGPFTAVNRSFISTSLVNDSLSYGDDLRKSRIQNLPNYKKANLGDNQQFIIIFQTIEIQRLSNQVQLLRVKLKQFERQLFNAQNYQVQIRQLTEKCFSYQRQREEYRDQLDKLNKICQTLYHENEMLKTKLSDVDSTLRQKYDSQKQKNLQLSQQIEKWKARYQAGQKSKMKELQDLRNLMECQRKSMIDREIREITIRFQTQRSNLENEIRKCRQMLQNKNREIEDLKQKCQKYEITVIQLKNYENLINENESKLILLNQQVMRLNEILRNKDDQIQNYKQKEYKLNQQIKEQKDWEYQNKQLKGAVENRQRQIDEWKIRVSRLEEQATRGRQLTHYNNELNNKLVVASKQIQRMNGLLKMKLEEIEEWKKRVSEKDIEVSKYKNLQNQIGRYESKISMMQVENDRINGILKSRLGEIQEWRNKYGRLQSNLNGMMGLEKDKKNIENKYNEQVRIIEQFKLILSKMEGDHRNYLQKQKIWAQTQRKNESLNREIQRLNNVLKNNGQQLNDLRIRYSKVQSTMNQYRNIQNKLKDFDSKIGLLTQEIERLNTLIRNKNQDIEQLEKEKLQLHTKMNFYKNYEIKISEGEQTVKQLNNTINKLKSDIQNWQNRCKQAEAKGRDIQNSLFALTQEKEKFANIVKTKNQQNDQLRLKYNRLQDQSRIINDLKMMCQEQHDQISAYISDLDRYQKKITSLESELAREVSLSNDLSCRIIVLSSEIERLKKQGVSKGAINKEIEQIKQNFARLTSRVKSKQNEIQILMVNITHLQSKISQLTKEYMRLLKEAEKNEKESFTLIKKIEEYQDYAKRIHILGSEIDRLISLNQGLQQDIKKMRLRYADNINGEKKLENYNLILFIMSVQIQSLRSRVEERSLNQDQMRKSILDPIRRI